MKKIDEYIEDLNLLDNIEISDIPNIELYMDQVIQLFESKLENFKRNDEDKIMTKTMINNYVKGKLLMPVTKKKYSKEHIMLINLIYQLKGGLAISDIKILLELIAKDIEEGKEVELEKTYQNYIDINIKNANDFTNEVMGIKDLIVNDLGESENKELLAVTALINKANMYKRLAEKIIDDKLKVDKK